MIADDDVAAVVEVGVDGDDDIAVDLLCNERVDNDDDDAADRDDIVVKDVEFAAADDEGVVDDTFGEDLDGLCEDDDEADDFFFEDFDDDDDMG